MSFGSGPTEIVSIGSGTSPSLLFNNLSIDAGMVAYAHKSSVFVFLEASARSAGVAPTKIGYRDAAAVTQVRWCNAGIGSALLTVATTAGFQVWDSSGKACLFTHTVSDGFCRGVASSDESRKIFVGSSSGKVYAVTGSSPIALSTEFEAHTSPISALDVHGTVLATAADSGEIKLWDTGSLKELVTFAGHGHPCTSVKVRDAYVVASYTSGHVRVFDIASDSLAVEIAAHSRCVNALDLHPVADTFVSVGEDAVVNVWSLPERSSGSYKVELLCSKSVEDHLFTGVQFFKSPRMAVLASSYDNCVMALIQ